MGLDTSFEAAFAKSQTAAGQKLPVSGCVFISVREGDKPAMVEIGRALSEMGFKLIATAGTMAYLREAGLEVERINKVAEGRRHIVDEMIDGAVQLVFNTTEGAQAFRDSFSIRRTALSQNIPYYTTVSGARAAVLAIRHLRTGALGVRPLQAYA